MEPGKSFDTFALAVTMTPRTEATIHQETQECGGDTDAIEELWKWGIFRWVTGMLWSAAAGRVIRQDEECMAPVTSRGTLSRS